MEFIGGPARLFNGPLSQGHLGAERRWEILMEGPGGCLTARISMKRVHGDRKSKSPPCLRKNRGDKGGAPLRLDVFQPTGFARRFYVGEPAAGEIEEGDCDCPDCIQEGEAPGVSVGGFGVAHGVIGEEPRTYVAQTNLRDD